MEESSNAQKQQILSDWRSRFSPDELKYLVVQLDSLVELAQEEGAHCPECGEELECTTSRCPWVGGGSLTRRALDKVSTCPVCGGTLTIKPDGKLVG